MRKRETRAAAIVGIGATKFTSASGVSELDLAVEAIGKALDDAGLTWTDVDGLVTYDMDSNDPLQLTSALSLGDLSWFSQTPYGGGQACSTVQDAVLAVEHGLADVVVVHRAANMRSGYRFGRAENTPYMIFPGGRWTAPYGLITPAQLGSLWFQRYFHKYGLTNDDLAPVVLTARQYAATNPAAVFYERPLTLDGYLAEPWVCEPVLRRADCCLETDGAIAMIVSTLDRGRGAGRPAVEVVGAARGMAKQSSHLRNYFREDATDLPDMKVVADQLWQQSGLAPSDISLVTVYDSFSPVVLMALETFGFCEEGQAAAFVAAGEIGPGGSLPVNPHGGLIGEGYIQGFNGIVEAVRQLRGDAANQIEDASAAVVTGGPPLPSSGLIFQRDGV
jgi:acetyl-CoA acetyltransferase